ncbi:hypothetical protein HPB47_003093 [Ixodes persulcatus]|uniref:Uncharacterized protein n=1 Tax=Ixodes persulcatus TaxID=34615 RepID=A0AC60PKG0_IXOPE|nr:hypothetical protein HPB47_003093 [Ixodes persulcatus]
MAGIADAQSVEVATLRKRTRLASALDEFLSFSESETTSFLSSPRLPAIVAVARSARKEHENAFLAIWTERLVSDKNTYTETTNLTTETPELGRHLLHLWEARHGLIKRWKCQKLIRKLKKRIAAITAEALQYATQLACSNWNKKYTDLQGKLGSNDAWQFLRHLGDPKKANASPAKRSKKIVRDFTCTNKDLLEQLKQRYIGSPPNREHHDYEGEPNPDLDAHFNFEELWNPLQDMGVSKTSCSATRARARSRPS